MNIREKCLLYGKNNCSVNASATICTQQNQTTSSNFLNYNPHDIFMPLCWTKLQIFCKITTKKKQWLSNNNNGRAKYRASFCNLLLIFKENNFNLSPSMNCPTVSNKRTNFNFCRCYTNNGGTTFILKAVNQTFWHFNQNINE